MTFPSCFVLFECPSRTLQLTTHKLIKPFKTNPNSRPDESRPEAVNETLELEFSDFYYPMVDSRYESYKSLLR